MQVEYIATGRLIPYEFNNVKHPEAQVDRIANSISEFGFTVPIVVNKGNIVIAGHGRLLAAQKLGLQEVPVVRLENLSNTQEKAYRILDNKLARDSDWDFDNLGIEFDFLKDQGFDFSAWGLDNMIPQPVIPKEYTEEIADGVQLETTFKLTIPIQDSDSFEERLDELLRQFPTASKQKST